MFELMRRFKQRVKRITDAQGHIVLSKFFKEFPRIAKNMNDVNLIAEQGLATQFIVPKKEQSSDDGEESVEIKVKRKYTRRAPLKVKNSEETNKQAEDSEMQDQNTIKEDEESEEELTEPMQWESQAEEEDEEIESSMDEYGEVEESEQEMEDESDSSAYSQKEEEGEIKEESPIVKDLTVLKADNEPKRRGRPPKIRKLSERKQSLQKILHRKSLDFSDKGLSSKEHKLAEEFKVLKEQIQTKWEEL